MQYLPNPLSHGPGRGLCVAVLSAGLLMAGPAAAGGATDARQITDELGVRTTKPISEPEPGRSYEVIVEDPDKLAEHGVQGVSEGQRLRISLSKRATGNNPFLAIQGMPGSTLRLPVREDGRLGKAAQAEGFPAGANTIQKSGEASPRLRGRQPGKRGDYPAPDNFDSPDGTTSGGDDAGASQDNPDATSMPSAGNGGQGPLGDGPDGTEAERSDTQQIPAAGSRADPMPDGGTVQTPGSGAAQPGPDGAGAVRPETPQPVREPR